MDIKETETNTEEVIIDESEQIEADPAAGEDKSTSTEEGAALEVEDDGNEVVVSIGEEPDPQAEEEKKAPQWVRDLRKNHRDLLKEKKELEARLAAVTEAKPVQLGKKPTLESCDFDEEKFANALEDWHEKKSRVDREEQKRKDDAKAQDTAWQGRLENYGKLRTEIKVKDFQEAESETQNALSVIQQGIVIQGAENPALVVYALGKNPKARADLAAITDPVKFAFAVAKLEAQLKITPKKTTPAPEKVLTGSGRISGSVDSALARLEAEADKTGDRSKVVAYKRKLKQNSK